jgi:tetratricopeptide (TPR) repeat protein
MKGQFYRYASGYREAGQWPRAEAIYERLLARYPLDKQGTLDYAAMEYEDLADYPKAISILDAYLAVEKQTDDYDVLLLSADVNLEWGREEPSRLEDARFALAKLMDAHGVRNEFLFRMLRYFIRTDNMAEVQILKNRFQADPKLEVDPSAYAELGGYLLDNNITEEVNEVLFRAKDADETLPEIHYQLARFFNKISDRQEEQKALNNTILFLGRLPRLNGERHFMYMDSYRRLGEIHFADSRFLEAEQAYRSGIELYESARDRGILPVRPEAGMLYADMADIPYYVGGDLDLAMEYLKKAEANNYTNRDVKYKIGYIHYWNEDFRTALLRFSSAADGFTTDPNLSFSIANTLYRRNNLQAAEGYYRTLIKRLEERRYGISNFTPSERKEHLAVLENLIRVNNNLAVARYEVYRRTGRGEAYTEALVNLSNANELFENYNRDPETLERSPLKNLAYLNQRGMLYPDSDFRPQIYPEIPKDLETAFFAP